MTLLAQDAPVRPPSPPVAGPFASARTLLAEAAEAVAEFHAACMTFTREAACTKVSARDARTGHEHVKVAIQQCPPPRLRTLAFMVAYKLRRALDQAAIAGAVELGCAERSGGFPFGGSVGEFEDSVARNCAGYDPALVAHFRALKPHGGDAGDELLATLGTMAGAQRSQLTIELGLDAAKVSIQTLVLRLTGPGETGNLGWDRKKRELHIATLTAEDSELVAGITTRTRLPLVVEMGGAAAYGEQEAGRLLDTLLDKAGGIVRGIEAETARLKHARAP